MASTKAKRLPWKIVFGGVIANTFSVLCLPYCLYFTYLIFKYSPDPIVAAVLVSSRGFTSLRTPDHDRTRRLRTDIEAQGPQQTGGRNLRLFQQFTKMLRTSLNTSAIHAHGTFQRSTLSC